MVKIFKEAEIRQEIKKRKEESKRRKQQEPQPVISSSKGKQAVSPTQPQSGSGGRIKVH